MTLITNIRRTGVAVMATCLLAACATVPTEDNYVLYRQHMPRSILVFPPANESVDVNAPYSWVTTVSKPIVEQGYYVFPVAIVDQFMKENGLPQPEDMHTAPLDKIHEVFGADAVLYVTLEEFGQKFELLSSTTRIYARAELVDVKTGQRLWSGSHRYAQNSSGGGNGLVGELIAAAITQIGNSVTDYTHDAAFIANQQFFRARRNGLLLGPRHPGHAEAMAEAEAKATAEAAVPGTPPEPAPSEDAEQ